MMERSPFKMDTFPNLISWKDGIIVEEAEAEIDTDAEQPMSVIGKDNTVDVRYEEMKNQFVKKWMKRIEKNWKETRIKI